MTTPTADTGPICQTCDKPDNNGHNLVHCVRYLADRLSAVESRITELADMPHNRWRKDRRAAVLEDAQSTAPADVEPGPGTVAPGVALAKCSRCGHVTHAPGHCGFRYCGCRGGAAAERPAGERKCQSWCGGDAAACDVFAHTCHSAPGQPCACTDECAQAGCALNPVIPAPPRVENARELASGEAGCVHGKNWYWCPECPTEPIPRTPAQPSPSPPVTPGSMTDGEARRLSRSADVSTTMSPREWACNCIDGTGHSGECDLVAAGIEGYLRYIAAEPKSAPPVTPGETASGMVYRHGIEQMRGLVIAWIAQSTLIDNHARQVLTDQIFAIMPPAGRQATGVALTDEARRAIEGWRALTDAHRDVVMLYLQRERDTDECYAARALLAALGRTGT